MKYLFVYSTPIAVFLSIYLGGIWSYFAVCFLFVFIPFVELLLAGSAQNMDKAAEEVAKNDKIYDFLLYSLVPIQYALFIYFLFKMEKNELELYEKIGTTIALGMSCGILGINAAHELGHRSTWYEQTMSKMLLLTSQYMHFFIEHNRGHHKNVSTPKDPASSRYGESLYAFWLRSVRDSWLSAWHLERERMKRKDKNIWSFENEMIQYTCIQASSLIIIALCFSLSTMFYGLAAAVLGFLLLETVNYIEHYGLSRKENNGIYERTMPIHSWNSNHPLGRLLLLELTRHSDHHFLANRKYQILRHFDESPQMPTGYPGMMLLSMVPPLWFYVMHKHIEKYKKTQEGLALA